METSWHSYPSIYALGHRCIQDLLLDPVLVEEKVDGSQFSFGVFINPEGERFLKCRSKGSDINIFAPEKMFKAAVDYVQSIESTLRVGWTYRAEYLAKPKHNVLAYDRIPKNHLIIFDVNDGHESYMPWHTKRLAAEEIGLETVPMIHEGKIDNVEQFREFLDRTSVLGGQKIEGVVVKNYLRFGLDKKVLLGKFVSEAFKEVHQREWKASNPSVNDIVDMLIQSLRTPARWNKAVQHAKEKGVLTDSPKDIGLLIKEIQADVEKEEAEFIKEKLYQFAWPRIARAIIGGFPEHYKEILLKKQFETDEVSI